MVRLYWTKNKETGKVIDPFRFKKNCELKVQKLNEEAGYEKYELSYEDVSVSQFPEWSWYWSYKTEEIEYKAIFEGIIPEDD